MNANEFVNGLDLLFQEGRVEEVPGYLTNWEEKAREERDLGVLLMIQNEKMGYYRSIREFETACDAFIEACAIMEMLHLNEGAAFATTLVNGATVFTAAGDYEKALTLYEQAEKVYEEGEIKGTFEVAGLYNNMSMLYEKLGKWDESVECLTLAIKILENLPDCEEEKVTSYANLGQTYYQAGDLGAAADAFAKAMELCEETFGKDELFEILERNYAFVCEQISTLTSEE